MKKNQSLRVWMIINEEKMEGEGLAVFCVGIFSLCTKEIEIGKGEVEMASGIFCVVFLCWR